MLLSVANRFGYVSVFVHVIATKSPHNKIILNAKFTVCTSWLKNLAASWLLCFRREPSQPNHQSKLSEDVHMCDFLLISVSCNIYGYRILDSCQWGPANAHGVGMLTEMYVIYGGFIPLCTC